MSAVIGWGLAVAAVAAGYMGWGWRGVVLGLTVIAFWLLLQFSRALRVLRRAAGAPLGWVPNAVMFQARLQAGLRLPQVLALSGSLGRRLDSTDAADEGYVWQDDAGDTVTVRLVGGRVCAWDLQRAQGAEVAAALGPPGEPAA